jgi:hypothetical protein
MFNVLDSFLKFSGKNYSLILLDKDPAPDRQALGSWMPIRIRIRHNDADPTVSVSTILLPAPSPPPPPNRFLDKFSVFGAWFLCREGIFLLPYNELAVAQGPKIHQKNEP